MEFNKSLLLIVSFYSLLLSCTAVPSTFLIDTVTTVVQVETSSAPSPAPVTILMDSIGTGPLDYVKAAILEQKTDPALTNLCKDAENITLCVDTIAPFMQGQVDPVKAVEAEMDALQKQTQKTIDIIARLSTEYRSNKNMADTLDVCRENYESNMDDIKKAVDAIKTVDIGTAQSMLSGVIGSMETCKDTFGDSGLEFPFPDDSTAEYQLAGNTLGILNLIQL